MYARSLRRDPSRAGRLQRRPWRCVASRRDTEKSRNTWICEERYRAMDGIQLDMNANRKRISGRLEHLPRGAAIVTDAGDHWVLEGFEPSNDDFGFEVTAEGVVVGLDRLRVDWLGAC